MARAGEAIPLFEDSGDEAGLARALGVAGTLRFWRGEAAAAIEDLERSARYAHEVSDRAQEAETLQYVLMAILLGPTPVDQALARVEALAPRRELNRQVAVHFLRTRAHLEAMRGRFKAARDAIAQAKALAEDLGLEVLQARVALQAGPVELLAGDPAAAERELRPAFEALARMGHWGHLVSIAPRLADALYLQGRDEEALRLTAFGPFAVPEDVDAQISWRRVQAKVLGRGGDTEKGKRLARDATARAAGTDYLDLHANAVADLAEVLRLAGRPEESAAAVQEAIRLYEQKGNIAAAAALAATTSVSAPP